jgi:ATP/maltotriose-dependent transcriptional regulator MalT
MRELRSVLDHAFSGRGRLVMLAGEAGIGKTRTAQQLASCAEGEGARVLWGRCYEEEDSPPYWPWTQILQSLVRDKSAEQIILDFGHNAADIAQMAPELREKLPDLKRTPILDPAQARFRFFNSVTSALENAARVRPLVLILDDLHWADKSSLRLLQFLARRLGGHCILIIGIYRDAEISRQHPLSDTLAQLAREPVFLRLALQGLSREDTGYFIGAMAGIRANRRVIDAIYSHTEGNPFFTTEVLRFLREPAKLTAEEILSIALPPGVREAIGQRLNRLSEQCQQTLTTASIIGREFELRLLGRLNRDTSEEQLLAVLDEALDAHLVEELPGRAEGYQFSHALVQETLASEVSAARRVRLHARIAEALEELYAAAANEHASEVAYHFDKARAIAGTERLVRYSIVAGEQSLAKHAYEEALQHFERAWAAKRELPMDDETARLLVGLGRAQDAAYGKPGFTEAVGNLILAFDYYTGVGEVERAVAIAGYPFQFWTDPPPGVFTLIQRGLALVPPESPAAGPLLLSHGRRQGIDQCDYDAAVQTFEQVLELANHYQDTALEVQALAWTATVEFFHLRFSECLESCRRAITLARNSGDLRIVANCGLWASLVLAAQGNLHQSALYTRSSLEAAVRVDRGLTLANALWGNQVVAQLEGNWDNARSFCDEGLSVWPADPRCLASRTYMEYLLGNFPEAMVYLDRLLDVLGSCSPGPNIEHAAAALAIPLAATVRNIPQELKTAEFAARHVVSFPNASPFLVLMARAGLALCSVIQNDTRSASALYRDLESQLKGTLIITVSGDRLLGKLAHTIGKADWARAHFDDALDFCRNSGYRPELAWTCCDCAEALFHTGTDPDLSRGAALLEESLSISEELGILPLSQRAGALQQQFESRASTLRGHPDGLTSREIEVLICVALGKSNREIAQELTISPNTVVSHISNIFNKIGAANRTEAATYANRHGLPP